MAMSMRLGTMFRRIQPFSICGPRSGKSSLYIFADGVGIRTSLFVTDGGMQYKSFASGTAIRNFHSTSCLLPVKNPSKGRFVSSTRRLHTQDNSSKTAQPLNEQRRYLLFGPHTLEELKIKEGDKWLDAVFHKTMVGKFVMKTMRPLMEYSEIVEESSKHPTFKYVVKGVHTFLSWVKYLVLISLGPWLKTVFDEFRGKTKNADDRLQAAFEVMRQLEEKDREIQTKDRHTERLEREAEMEKKNRQIERLERDLLALKIVIAMSSKNRVANYVQALGPEDLYVSRFLKLRKEDL